MGIDAESSDLTARIQAKRRRLVAAGELEPARPGEHAIFGRHPGAADDLEAVGRAADVRGRRTMRPAVEIAGGDAVVEMDMTDYTGTQPGTKEAQAAAEAEAEFDLDDDDADEADLFSLDDLAIADEVVASHVFPDEPEVVSATEQRLDGIERALELIAEIIDGIATRDEMALALVSIAEAVERLTHPLVTVHVPPESTLSSDVLGPEIGLIRRFWRWIF